MMNRFFYALIIIAVSVIILAGYYVLKNLLARRKADTRRRRIRQKLYEDGRIYLTNVLRHRLRQLGRSEIQWIQVSSANDRYTKFELTYSPLEEYVYIVERGRPLTGTESRHVKDMGVTLFERKDDCNIYTCDVNSKIISDVLYFLFEIVHQQKKTFNIKVRTSGETGI